MNAWQRSGGEIESEEAAERLLGTPGTVASTLPHNKELKEIEKEIKFSHSQITHLYSWITSLDKGQKRTASWGTFPEHSRTERVSCQEAELAINPLWGWIINAFSEEENQINFGGFMRILSHFLSLRVMKPISPTSPPPPNKFVNEPRPLNSQSNKLHLAFRLYKLNKDDKIPHDEMLQGFCMVIGLNASHGGLRKWLSD
uniref:calcineurin B homologous protein 1-like n=1 Tax=Jaculus jaculus TaxID=51337 RepID=UPI001E1B34C7|nr:calcineurin B homologous protein 1-like [Jaculus jaculus]